MTCARLCFAEAVIGTPVAPTVAFWVHMHFSCMRPKVHAQPKWDLNNKSMIFYGPLFSPHVQCVA